MQDLHAIGDGGGCGGAGGQFFGGGGGDRRFRPHNHLNHQALKCPRCDSLNTKFCYYNNYNLSQPRHFCKACRRYWTKGGVLRSVPVGGGCRKTKRSKAKSTAAEAARERRVKAQSPSSTDSSSLTAATPFSAAVAAPDEGSAPSNSSAKRRYSDSAFFSANPDPTFSDPQLFSGPTDSQISPQIENLAGTAKSPQNAAGMMTFTLPSIPPKTYDTIRRPEADAPENPCSEIAGITDVDVFKMPDVGDDGLASALDWDDGGADGTDQGLFDLTAAFDPAYWSQPQWSDSDHPLNYLP